MEKYEFTGEQMEYEGVTVHRIRALKTFFTPFKTKIGDKICVWQGDLGGYIESGYNLDQNGPGWVAGKAIVMGNAKVYEKGFVGDRAVIKDYAEVYGCAKVIGDSRLKDFAIARDSSVLSGESELGGQIKITGHTKLKNAKLSGDLEIHNNSIKKK